MPAVVLFDATRRNGRRAEFGRGIYPTRYTGQFCGTMPFTVSDALWAAQEFGNAQDARDIAHWNAAVDALAREYDAENSAK